MKDLPVSEASERNKAPTLAVLREAFADRQAVLEVGSGTGQHAVYFARHLPHLRWLATELPGNLPDLAARLAAEGGDNLEQPQPLDVFDQAWPGPPACDAIFTANTLHIVSLPCVEAFFLGAGQVLPVSGVLVVYGPFRYRGDYTTPSNAAFDTWLKQRDARSGIRDFEWVNGLAAAQGLELREDRAMPANNQCLVWVRTRRDASA